MVTTGRLCVSSDTQVASGQQSQNKVLSKRVFVLFWNSFVHGNVTEGFHSTIKLTVIIWCFSTVLYLADLPDNLVPEYQTHLHIMVFLTHPLVVYPILQHDIQMSNHREWVHWVLGSWDSGMMAAVHTAAWQWAMEVELCWHWVLPASLKLSSVLHLSHLVSSPSDESQTPCLHNKDPRESTSEALFATYETQSKRETQLKPTVCIS